MVVHVTTKNVRQVTDERFMVFGERNSGTNYLSNLISSNFGLVDSNLIMWKHWMGFRNPNANLSVLDNTLAIGIIRDPIDWLSSMKAHAPHASHISNLSWPNFLQSEWWSIHDNRDYGYEIMEDRDFDTGQRYQNIMKMRSKKLSWLLNPDIPCPYALVRYEDLLNSYKEVLGIIRDVFQIPQKNNPFTNILKDMKHGGSYKKRTHQKPPKQCFNMILNGLDWTLEETVGYSKTIL